MESCMKAAAYRTLYSTPLASGEEGVSLKKRKLRPADLLDKKKKKKKA